MATIPRRFLVHEISIEPYLGDTSKGPTYGPAVAVRCLLDEQTRGVRSAAGEQVTSTSTAYCLPGTTAVPFSRVRLPSGRVTKVIQTKNRDGKGLGTPNHVEIQLE